MTREAEAKSWIGKTIAREDVASSRLIAEFESTLHPHLAPSDGAALGFHWCLCPDIFTSDKLGEDGHPLLGVLLPETGLPRRMWAGGEIIYHGVIRADDHVKRVSSIEDVAFKTGKTGKLCFVTVRHHYVVAGTLVIDDRQDIVYREQSIMNSVVPVVAPVEQPADPVKVTATPTLLFRYSAITFNGHRIHYDKPYARDIEHYAGLVVHGPLQATLMLNVAATRLRRIPRRFGYRGLNPLICDQAFYVDAKPNDTGGLTTRVFDANGVTTMTGSGD